MSSLKPIHPVPSEEGAKYLTDRELREKLNEMIDQLNAQLNEITSLRGQVSSFQAK